MTLEVLFKDLNTQTTILTPNRRLSATLQKQFQSFQLSQEHACWQTPDILPLSSWLKRCWQQHILNTVAPSPQLLNAAQEQFVWEKIILQTKHSHQLLQVSETAQ